MRFGVWVGELTVFPTLPIAALIFSAFLMEEPTSLSFKNGKARRITTQGFILECVADTPVGFFEATNPRWRAALLGVAAAPVTHFVSSGAEYTPLTGQCQYLVAIFFFNAIECIP